MDKEYVLNELVKGKWVVRRVKGDGSALFSVVLTADLSTNRRPVRATREQNSLVRWRRA